MLSLNLRIRNRLRWIYVITDFVTTNLAMFCFNIFRWVQKGGMVADISVFYHYPKVWLGQIVFPLIMMFIYWLSGYYNHVETRSRTQETITTFLSVIFGALTIFFLAVVNDFSWRRTFVFENLMVSGSLLFGFVYLGRFMITRTEVKRVHTRHHIKDAVIIGTDKHAIALARRINGLPKGMGIRITALVNRRGEHPIEETDIETIDYASLHHLLSCRGVGMIILSPEIGWRDAGFGELMRLAVELDIPMFISPDVGTLAIAAKRTFNVLGEPLVCISHPSVSDSTINLKRTSDVVTSLIALTLLSPLFLAMAIAIKIDSPGSIFFRQTRLGRGGKPFKIIKFRSMRMNAEPDGKPMVTTDNDPRITRIGHFMRKYRIDEFPQFINVLRGEMSIVGPRPERKFFADRIAEKVPVYPLIYQVRPGITSWGMVRYGYASTIDEMVERLRYDLLYLETVSISTDLKIMLHTINTVISGRGK